jgi:AcrR family transcriptional regulator
MFAPRHSDAAERILGAAMRLFSEQGYERTTIADIQAAAGLNPGSGALYKHFPSKEAVLRAGVARFVDETRQAEALIDAMPGRADDVLLLLGRAALDMLAHDRDMLRVMWRELEPFPELRDAARDHRAQATYAAVAGWLRARAARGEVHAPDPEATAVALLGSLTMFRVFEALLGEKPGHVDDERLLRAWHTLVTRGLHVDDGATAAGLRADRGAAEDPGTTPGPP